MTPAVHAVDLYRIYGVVTDKAGRTLEGVNVTTGGTPDTTDTGGNYSLGQGSTGSFTVTATRSDLVTARATVAVNLPIDYRQDFSMLYRMSSVVSPSSLSSASAPVTVTSTISSYAPLPGTPGQTGGKSCVYVTDSRTNTTGSATYVSSGSGGLSTWQYSVTVPTGAPNGSYTLSAVAKDCATDTVLSASSSPNYVVDNTPIPANTPVLPGDKGNTVFNNQPLMAQISDAGGSGVKSSSISFTLTDTTVPDTRTFSGSAVTWNSSTKWAKTTSAVSLVQGHVYRMSWTASDNAGNVTTYTQEDALNGGGFLVTTAAPANSTGMIPAADCTVGSAIDATGMKAVTCNNVPVNVAASTIALGGVRSAGAGLVKQRLELNSAVFATTASGLELTWPAYQASDPKWGPRNIDTRFDVRQASATPITVDVPQYNGNLGTLTGKVPATWTSATLRMSPTSTQAFQATCADPLVAVTGCSPDPIVNVRHLVWSPTMPEAHVSTCDAAISHKELVALPAGAAANLSFTVDTAKLAPTSASLLYSVNDGPQARIDVAGAASTYTFTVPASSLSEGARLNYAAIAYGTFSSPNCANIAGAVSPSNSGFASLATNTATSANTALQSVVYEAGAAAMNQPTPLIGLDVSCPVFFASPTPCELFPAVNVTENPPPPALNAIGLELVDEPPQGGQMSTMGGPVYGDCYTKDGGKTIVFTNDYLGHHEFIHKSKNGPATSSQKLEQKHSEVWGRNAILQEVAVGGSMWPNASVRSESTGRVGYSVYIYHAGMVYTKPYNVTLKYNTKGKNHALAGPAWPFKSSDATAETTNSLSTGYRVEPWDAGSRYGGQAHLGNGGVNMSYQGQDIAFAGGREGSNTFSKSSSQTWNNLSIRDYDDWFFYVEEALVARGTYDGNSGANATADFHDDGDSRWLEATELSITVLDSSYWKGC